MRQPTMVFTTATKANPMSKNADKNSYPRLKKEITVFLIMIGVLIGAVGYYAFTGLRDNPNPLWGLDRHLAIGVPLLIIGLLHVASGACLAMTSRAVFAVLGGLFGTMFALFYFGFMISATGRFPINLISGVVIAVPLVLWSRVFAFLKASDSGAGGEHQEPHVPL